MTPEKVEESKSAAAPSASPVANTAVTDVKDVTTSSTDSKEITTLSTDAAKEVTTSSADANASIVSVDSTNGEHDPYFEPVVSLPEVETKTLEEDEVVIYQGRCKLFRFVTSAEDGGEWKERGTGDVKLLRHDANATVRVLMRQEKTLKVRANHYITPLLRLRPNCGSDRAFVWHVMCDFADEEGKGEMFAIKFANPHNALQFKQAFEGAVRYVASSVASSGVMEAIGGALRLEEEEEEDEGEEEKDAKEGLTGEGKSEEKKDEVKDDGEGKSAVVEGLEKLSVKEGAQ